MTLIVGILCKDGAVIGADSAGTSGDASRAVMEYGPLRKIKSIGKSAITACTGEVGFSQRHEAILSKLFDGKDPNFARKSPIEIAKSISTKLIEDAHSTKINQIPIGSVTAFSHEERSRNKVSLAEFSWGSFQPELKTIESSFVCLGSGQIYADPFLAFLCRVFWRRDLPTVNQAIFYTTWAIQHAIRVNTGGVNSPIRISTMRLIGNSVEIENLDEEDHSLDEGLQLVTKVEQYLENYLQTLTPNGEANEGDQTIPTIDTAS